MDLLTTLRAFREKLEDERIPVNKKIRAIEALKLVNMATGGDKSSQSCHEAVVQSKLIPVVKHLRRHSDQNLARRAKELVDHWRCGLAPDSTQSSAKSAPSLPSAENPVTVAKKPSASSSHMFSQPACQKKVIQESSKSHRDIQTSPQELSTNKPKKHKSIDSSSGFSFTEALEMSSSSYSPKKRHKSSHSSKPSHDIIKTSPSRDVSSTAGSKHTAALKLPELPTVEPGDLMGDFAEMYHLRVPNHAIPGPTQAKPEPVEDQSSEDYGNLKLNTGRIIFSGKKRVQSTTSGNASKSNGFAVLPNSTNGTTGFRQQPLSLVKLCQNVLLHHIDSIDYLGHLPFELAKPIYEACSIDQLKRLDRVNPQYRKDAEPIWKNLCMRHYRNRLPSNTGGISYRKAYLRFEAHDAEKLEKSREKMLDTITKQNADTHRTILTDQVVTPRKMRRLQEASGILQFHRPKQRHQSHRHVSTTEVASSSSSRQSRTPVMAKCIRMAKQAALRRN